MILEIIIVYIILIIFFSSTIDKNSPNNEVMFTFILPLVLLTSTLIRICYKKGEKPHWWWGLDKK